MMTPQHVINEYYSIYNCFIDTDFCELPPLAKKLYFNEISRLCVFAETKDYRIEITNNLIIMLQCLDNLMGYTGERRYHINAIPNQFIWYRDSSAGIKFKRIVNVLPVSEHNSRSIPLDVIILLQQYKNNKRWSKIYENCKVRHPNQIIINSA